jgi:hypothetical protein
MRDGCYGGGCESLQGQKKGDDVVYCRDRNVENTRHEKDPDQELSAGD